MKVMKEGRKGGREGGIKTYLPFYLSICLMNREKVKVRNKEMPNHILCLGMDVVYGGCYRRCPQVHLLGTLSIPSKTESRE